ncbi:MAG: hypothetical protein CM1200mP2_29810 [Planctomycetaceae bacterium]|nr:MAG: hypothetical protein CM1200mP2_29810 [Planctomycetaceae bacterium]
MTSDTATGSCPDRHLFRHFRAVQQHSGPPQVSQAPSTEFGHIAEQFTRVALAHPRLHMTLTHNDRDVFDLPPTDRLIERLELFYGRDVTETLIWVENEAGGCKFGATSAIPARPSRTAKASTCFSMAGRSPTAHSATL